MEYMVLWYVCRCVAASVCTYIRMYAHTHVHAFTVVVLLLRSAERIAPMGWFCCSKLKVKCNCVDCGVTMGECPSLY